MTELTGNPLYGRLANQYAASDARKAFASMVASHRARMALLAEILEQGGCIKAVSSRDPGYSILLTRNASSEAPWRVTSFHGREPLGHREYDRLTGGSPIQNAFQELAGDDLRIVRRAAGAAPAPKVE